MPLIGAHWSPGHPAGRDERLARHWYCSPWVDRSVFTHGVSAIVAYDGDELRGMSSVLVTPSACWHMIWFVTPEAKGTGLGRKLIETMIAWCQPKPMHVLGIHPLGMPFYEKLNFERKLAIRYRFTGGGAPASSYEKPDEDWLRYRYDHHPIFTYERRGHTIVRRDFLNAYGRILHVARLGPDWPEALKGEEHVYDLIQAWAYDSPGQGWEMPPAHIPTVFHPVEARGNTLWVAGLPSLPSEIHGSDGGQDRPA